MEIWRVGYGEDKLPAVISRRTLAFALVIHLSFFIAFWLFAACHGLFDKKEEIIPIDLTVVVNENLNGKENEPPPLKKPEPEPPKPKPQPKPKPKVKEPEKPKELEKIVTNIVAKVDKKEEKKIEKPEKKPEKKEPEKPKKTKEQLRKERMEQMRKSAKQVKAKVTIEVKNAKESGDGRTDKRQYSEAELAKMLLSGYKPGKANQIAASENQRCLSLIWEAFHSKWTPPPWTDTLRKMYLRVRLGADGRILGYDLIQSSTDRNADQTVLSAASRVKVVPGLSAEFLRDNKTVRIDFEVKAQ